MLKVLHGRRERFQVEAVAGNKFGHPEWSPQRIADISPFVERLHLYRGERSWRDYIHSRAQSAYHQRIRRRQLPVDSDYFAPPGYVRFVEKLVAERPFDAIWINNLDYAHLASRLRRPGMRRVIDIHDITSLFRLVRKDIAYSKDLRFDFEENFAREVELLRRFDHVIVDSRHEHEILAQRLPGGRLHFVPSQVAGLTEDAGRPYSSRVFAHDILFVGADNQPNREAVSFLLRDVMPYLVAERENVRLAIAGTISAAANVPETIAPNVLRLGYVNDLARLYLSSRVAVCPLRSGAGTKFKLVEAMAFGMPVVVTKHSAAALSLENGVNGFITDDPREYAEAVVRLIADPALAESFSRAVASTFAREHSTAAIGAELDVVLGAADA